MLEVYTITASLNKSDIKRTNVAQTHNLSFHEGNECNITGNTSWRKLGELGTLQKNLEHVFQNGALIL